MTTHSQSPHFLVRKSIISVLLVAVTVCAYWPVGGHEFVIYDDNEYVFDNPHVNQGLSVRDFVWAFTSSHSSNWHPLTWLSHQLDCSLFGLDASRHHQMNLLFHIINVLLLFLVLSRYTGSVFSSCVVAGLFALHPLHVESVAWVSERKDLLAAMFWLLCMWAYSCYALRPSAARYLLVLLMFCLGILSKPMIVTLPFVLLLLDYWPLRRWCEKEKADDVSVPQFSLGKLVIEKMPLFALSALSCAITVVAQRHGGAVRSFEHYPFSVRVANALVAYVNYIGKMFWPSNLATHYLHPGDTIPLWQPVCSALFLALVCFVAWRLRKAQPSFLIGWLWYLGTLVPVIGIVQVGSQATADRYTYLPLIGVFIMLAWGVPALTAKVRFRKEILAVAAIAPLILFATLTSVQAGYWHDDESLFGRSLAVYPDNPLMHNNLGLALQRQGRSEEAVAHYEEAIRISPTYPDAYNNLGQIMSQRGMPEHAIELYNKTIELAPLNAEAHNNLGSALSILKRNDDALKHLREALRLNPDFVDARSNLGVTFMAMQRYDDALAEFSKVLELAPDHFMTLNNSGIALFRMKRYREASERFIRLLEIKPESFFAYYYLGEIALAQNRVDEALKSLDRALELLPDFEAARVAKDRALEMADTADTK